MSESHQENHSATRAGLGEGDLRADYAAWRDRLRRKSDRNRTIIDLTDGAKHDQPSYWDPDLLFRDSDLRRSDDDHLAVLDLRPTATPDEIAAAYRRLARLHHPDRWANADARTRAHHEACMAAVNEAYHALKAHQRV